ncbi:MAG: type II/IV secretion system protein [Phycisphaeraceae bacterium]|nr:type II/IV secretion system protein [Phycisphaeraceae bacterium]
MNTGQPADVETTDAAAAIVNLVLLQALRDGGHDIHFEPLAQGGRLRFRVDGVLHEMMPPTPELFPKVIEHLKQMTEMSTSERRLPQQGRADLRLGERDVTLLASSVPVMHGERVCVKILDRGAGRLGLDMLDLSSENLQLIERMLGRRTGLILVSGQSGSGTTTLLYSMLMRLVDPKRAIVSVEDPVEVLLDGVSQVAIRPQIGLTFAQAIKSALRQCPDVLMVGDIRNAETMELALTAAMTYHLVLARFDSGPAVNALLRMMDLGADPYRINSALLAIVHQRLPRRLCAACRQPAEPALHLLPPEARQIIANMKDATFHAPGGCAACKNTGYRGRVALQEVLVMDESMRRALACGKDLAATARAAGLRSLLLDGLTKAGSGLTSIEDVAVALGETID